MKKKANSIPTTRVFDGDQFAEGLRNACLCLPFESLTLSGPEGAFEANGLLVSRGDRLILECSPKVGVTVPTPAKTGFSVLYTPEDFWTAKGRTLHGLTLSFTSIIPFIERGSTHGNRNGTFVSYEIEVRELSIVEVPLNEEAKASVEEMLKSLRARMGRSEDWQPRDVPEIVDVSFRALLPNTKLALFNAGVKRQESHPFFSFPGESQASDCFQGELNDWEFCFTQEGDDVMLYVRTKEGYNSPSPEHDLTVLNALLAAYAFMHGIVAVPWRVKHRRGDGFRSDKFTADFSIMENGPRPIGGSRCHAFGDSKTLPVRMLVLLTNYFSSASETAVLMKSYHWQHVQAAQGSSIHLYQCLHVCAILEGIAKQLLIKKFRWTEKQWETARAEDRIRSVALACKLPWEGFFDTIYSDWKRLRPTLAHGEFFGPAGAWEDDLFALTRHVSGGIMALILADAGWDEPIDFRTLSFTKHLYY